MITPQMQIDKMPIDNVAVTNTPVTNIPNKCNYRLHFIISCCLLIALCSWLSLSRWVVYNNTISEPIGWYVVNPYRDIEIKDIKVGGLYTIKLPETNMHTIKRLGYHTNTNTLLKRIVAVSGDAVSVNSVGVLINGHLFKHSRAYQSVRGVALNPLPIGYSHKLAKDEYFVMGDGDNSFDSRYFGVIGMANIISKADFIGKASYFQ